MEKYEKLEFDVFGGLCRLYFESFSKTGKQGSDTDPGISFDISFQGKPELASDGRSYAASGVISRTDARNLRDLITRFFDEYEKLQGARTPHGQEKTL